MKIGRIGAVLAAAVASLTLFGSTSFASTVTFNYDAVVTLIDQSGDLSLLPNAGAGLVVGQTIHGSFTYDTASPSQSFFVNTLDYSSAALTIVLPAATISGGGPIRVSNDSSGQDRIDIFGPSTTNNVAGTGGMHQIGTASQLNLVDSTSSVFNSLALPTVLNLSNFDFKNLSVQEFDISLDSSGDPAFLVGINDILFEVTSLSPVSETPLPAALPLFATGLGAMGLLGWRRKRKVAALAA